VLCAALPGFGSVGCWGVDFNVLSWWRGVDHAGPLRSLGVSNDGGGGEFQSLIILVADAIVLPLS